MSDLRIVTGAGGWLGRAVAERFSGRPLRLLVQHETEAGALARIAPDAQIVVGDVRSPDTLERLFDGARGAAVFHLAAIIHAREATKTVFDTNVGGTALVLDHSRRAGLRRVVYLSSSSPLGHNPSDDHVFDESSPYQPFGAYGRSKMEAEGLVRRANASELETVIVRCPWFYGPHQPDRQNRFFKLVRRGVFPMTGSGEQRRSLAYTDNIAKGLDLAVTVAGAAGETYWIADARPYTFREIIVAIRDALREAGLKTARRNIRLPGLLSSAAFFADRMIERTGRYVEPLHVLAEVNRTIACDITKARRELGYEPDVELTEGMRRSVRWCLDNGVEL
jgi:nucleoside-diphosphate-sugar epimerase